MLGFLKKLFGSKPEAAPEAPYKVETPVPAGDIAPQPVVVEGAGVVEVKAKPKAKGNKKPQAGKKPQGNKKPKTPKAKKVKPE